MFQYLKGDVGEMTCRKLLRSVSILIAYERFIDSNMDQTTFRFGFPDVSQNPLLGLNASQVLGHWLLPELSDGCFSVRATGRLQKKILGSFCLKIFQIWFKRFRDLLFMEGKLPIQIGGRSVNLHTTDLTSICYNTEDL